MCRALTNLSLNVPCRLLLPCLPLAIPLLLPSLSSILQGIASSTMSSFLSDFAIGMGGIDFGGSIEQPMRDWEVISIGGSSLEDIHRGASDNESSSSERVRVLCRIGGGTSRPRGRAQPSIAFREPVPVIMILPTSASWGVRRGSGSGDGRASPFTM